MLTRLFNFFVLAEEASTDTTGATAASPLGGWTGILLMVGFVVLILGVWVLLNPSSAKTIIPIVIGVVLVASGVQELRLSFAAKSVDATKWGWMIAGSAITIVFGIICIFAAFEILNLAMRLQLWPHGIDTLANALRQLLN